MLLSISGVRQYGKHDPSYLDDSLQGSYTLSSSFASSSLGNEEAAGAISEGTKIKRSEAAPPFKRNLSTAHTRQTYYELISHLKEKIVIKDRKRVGPFKTKTYKNCFLAKDAVTITQEYLKLPSRKAALEVCQEMTQKIGCWENACDDDQVMKDASMFFRFTSDHKRQSGTLSQVIHSRRNATKLEEEEPPSFSLTGEDSYVLGREDSDEEDTPLQDPLKTSTEAGAPSEALLSPSSSRYSRRSRMSQRSRSDTKSMRLPPRSRNLSLNRQSLPTMPTSATEASEGLSSSLHSRQSTATRSPNRRSRSVNSSAKNSSLRASSLRTSASRSPVNSRSPKRQPRTSRIRQPTTSTGSVQHEVKQLHQEVRQLYQEVRRLHKSQSSIPQPVTSHAGTDPMNLSCPTSMGLAEATETIAAEDAVPAAKPKPRTKLASAICSSTFHESISMMQTSQNLDAKNLDNSISNPATTAADKQESSSSLNKSPDRASAPSAA